MKTRNKGQRAGETVGAQPRACKQWDLSSILRAIIVKGRMWRHALVSHALARQTGRLWELPASQPALAYLVSSSPSPEE